MTIYEIVSPNQYATIRGEQLPCCAAVLLLGEGQCGIADVGTGKLVLPLFLFSGSTDWANEHLGGIQSYLDVHWCEIAAALDTVMVGGVAVQKLFANLIPALPSELWKQQRAEFISAKSTNDLVNKAWTLADRVRARYTRAANEPDE